MKHAFLVAACLISLSATGVAQTDSTALPPISLGPTMNINITRNINDYHVSGPVRDYVPGSLFGITADIPVGTETAVIATLGYYTLAFADRNTNLDVNASSTKDDATDIPFGDHELRTEGSFNYLALGTMFRISSFVVGFQFGLPLSGSITNSGDQIPFNLSRNGNTLEKDISPKSEDLNVLIEARVAGDFEITRTGSGALHFIISGAWPLTTIKDESGGFLPRLDDNFRLPVLQAGVSWLFSL